MVREMADHRREAGAAVGNSVQCAGCRVASTDDVQTTFAAVVVFDEFAVGSGTILVLLAEIQRTFNSACRCSAMPSGLSTTSSSSSELCSAFPLDIISVCNNSVCTFLTKKTMMMERHAL